MSRLPTGRSLLGKYGDSRLKSDPSPALVERTTMKNAKYSRLLLVAKKQAAEKKRKQVPSFCTFAVSDYGEMSPAAVDLQEWLVNQFKIKCEQAGKRADGCKPRCVIFATACALVFKWRWRLAVERC